MTSLDRANLARQPGTLIRGIDASRPASPAAAGALLKQLDAHGVLVLRGQRLTPEQFIQFARSLGELATDARNAFCSHEFAQLTFHSNIIENGVPTGYHDAGRQWRMDGAHLRLPYRATLLYAVEIPQHDGRALGDTEFLDTAAAYDALDPALRGQLAGMRALHPHGAGRKWRTRPYFADSGMTRIFHGGEEHPVVRAHPHTGRKCLFVSRGGTSHISGMNEHESERLLETLYRHLEEQAFIHRHSWQPGDLLLWDNASMQHRTRNDFSLPQRRLLYRTQLKGAPARRLFR
jgi:taurine dioxygenase